MRVLMPRLRRCDWSVSGGVIDCILVGLSLVFLSCLGIGHLLTPLPLMGVEVIGVLLLFGYGDADAVLLSTEWTLQVVSYL